MRNRRAADRPGMPIRILLVVVCLWLAVPGNAEAQFVAQAAVVPPEQFNAEIGLMFWKPTPELVITTGAFAPFGGTVDFVNSFGLEKKTFREYRFVSKAGRKHKLRFSKVEFAYEGSTVVQGAPVTTDIEWQLWRGGYEYDILLRSHGFIGIVTELKYNNIEASLSRAGQSIVTDQRVFVPTIGGIARGYLGDYISLTGEFTFMNIDGTELRGKFQDLDLYGIAHLGKSVGLQFGYRSVHVDYLVDDDAGDLRMKGPYFGGLLRF